MEVLGEDQALQAVLGRNDLGGIDNEALDFSQLENYINNDSENIYFHEALVGVDIKLQDPGSDANAVAYHHTARHQLPESPPDSGSEPPFSPSAADGVYSLEKVVPTSPPCISVKNLKQFLSYTPRPNPAFPLASLPHLLTTTTTTSPNSTPLYKSEDLNTENVPKKRRLSDASPNKSWDSAGLVKGESGLLESVPEKVDEDFSFTAGPSMFSDPSCQSIHFSPFQQGTWHHLLDPHLIPISAPNYRVDADKGFNYSTIDEAFVCQKKNHFQVTVHIQFPQMPHSVKGPEGIFKIDGFYLHFYGAKAESPSQTIKIEQSQADRSKKHFHPIKLEVTGDQILKSTIGRLHFSETTSNNMRKKGKPNPDQRYFHLVVGLCAHSGDRIFTVAAHASEKIIVRASNPGQFESDSAEPCWQKGQSCDAIYHSGRVGVNTDRPDEALVVHGNVKVTGRIVQPSDERAKTNVQELDTRTQLRNVSNMRIVSYQYRPEFVKHAGLSEDDTTDTGVIAQEVQKILPEAVKEAGDVTLPNGQQIDSFLLVNKERIFMENVGAVKELCKVTDNLETRIDELERINHKLSKLKRVDSLKSTSSGSTITSHRHRSSKNSHRHQTSPPNLLCTNNILQCTIVVLVLIMTFCLLAMVSLYFLEWHRRHHGPPPHHVVVSSAHPPPINRHVENSTVLVVPPTFPTATPPAKPHPPVTVPPPSSTTASTLPPGTVPILKPTILGAHCGTHCAVHCCGSQVDLPKPTRGDLGARSMNLSDDDNGDNSLKTPSVNALDSRQPWREESQWLLPYNASDRRKRRDLGQDMGQGRWLESLRLLELNATLGQEYCSNLQCVHGTGSLSYHIPLSQFLSQEFLTLQLSLSVPLLVAHCGEELPLACPQNSHPPPQKPDSHHLRKELLSTWRLPAGLYLRSSYTFRIVASHTPLSPCAMPQSDSGIKFIELTLVFQRKCDM